MTDRWHDLEARVAVLEAQLETLLTANEAGASALSRRPKASEPAKSVEAIARERFWLLEGLAEREPEPAVIFGGVVELPGRGSVQWQYGRTSAELLDQPWNELAGTLDALAHPVRLRVLQLIANGVTTTAELAEQDDLGTTGQLHHHLRALLAAGWLRSPGRGRYEVVVDRVVPLLTILLAADRP